MIKNEKQLLTFIRYAPVVAMFVFASIINILIFVQTEKNFEKDLENYEKTYIQSQKILVQTQVTKIYDDILNEREDLEDRLKQKLRNKVVEAHTIIESIYTNFKHEGEEKVFKLIRESLRNIRFNEGRGYFYIYKFKNAINILHPIKPEIEGTSLIDFQDDRNNYILRDLLKGHKNSDELFSTVYWVKPNNEKTQYKKISFTKRFAPLDIFIGTGEYVDEFTKELQRHMIEDHIQKSTYGKNGYVFVVDYEGNYLSHIKKEYIGLNRIHLTDKDGYKITQGIIQTAKKGDGFIRYKGTIMPETGKPAYKTTYVKGLEDWKWAIASGFYDKELIFYLDKKRSEIEQMHKEYLTKVILITMIITILLLLVANLLAKKLEKSFKEYNDRIINQMNENRKKDRVMYQQSKMASMGEMIGNIAHQWRQPLNLISTVASGTKIQQELGVLTPEKQAESLTTIIDSTQYLSQTIDDFREFFNPNKIVTHFSSSFLHQKTMLVLSARFKNKNIEIIENIEEGQLSSYENELVQALMNIFNNALDAHEENKQKRKLIFFDIKSVNSCDETSCQTVDCAQREKGAFTLITIKDNAGGIPEDKLSKVFEAYFTTKHQSQGTGIGLYMTYEIISKHLEGFISVSNTSYEYEGEEYKGAEFKICLPPKKIKEAK